MIMNDRDRAHERLDKIMNERARNLPGFQTDWKNTRIRASDYAHANDVWSRLEPGDPAPRFAPDDAWDGKFETPERRDRIEGRNRKPYGKMRGSLSIAMDSAEDFGSQPTSIIADLVEKRLRGRNLDLRQRGLVSGLKTYLADTKSIRDINPATIRGLLTALAA